MKAMIGMISVATFAAVAGNLALAADLPKEGRYDFTTCLSCSHNPIEFTAVKRAVGYEQLGASVSNPPGGMFDKGTFRCAGLAITLDGKTSDTRVCEMLFPDGGKILARLSLADDGTHVMEIIAGTGIYEGIVAGGVAKPLGPYPVIKAGTTQFCNRHTGTYKLK